LAFTEGILTLEGIAGKLLKVDLSRSRIFDDKLGESLVKDFIGGVGIATFLFLKTAKTESHPLSEESRLILMTGALTGTGVVGGNKTTLVARSPLTGIWGEATFSGMVGIELKRAGYDGIIFQGRAKLPVYLWVSDGQAELRDARRLWGMDTVETCGAIREELRLKDVRVAAIGPAGEKLVRLACVMTDDSRAAGRCGIGAVMGSKNLKAIAAKGDGNIEVADQDRFKELNKEALRRIAEKKPLPFGTAGSVVAFEEMGNLPIKNWTAGSFLGASALSGQTMAQTMRASKKACFACPIACGRHIEIKDGPYAPLQGSGPEYETIACLGSLCLNDNLESIAKANDVCNRMGIDTISTGGAIAFAMECYEKGIITIEDLGGVKLEWGKSEAIVEMCKLIGKREGFGAVLGEGVRIAADKIGKGAEKFAIHVKGLELPAHSPYRFKEMGLAYAVSNRGACHNRGSPAYVSRGFLSPEIGLDTKTDGFTITGKGKMTKIHQEACLVTDATGICKYVVFFGGLDLSLLSELYSAVTGYQTDLDDMMKKAGKIWLMQRAFNVRLGITRKDDTLPSRFLKDHLKDGPTKGQTVDLDPMLNEYYNERGLDEEGKPKQDIQENSSSF
jgi:aldehyde:ferredoxin oxidoreductase